MPTDPTPIPTEALDAAEREFRIRFAVAGNDEAARALRHALAAAAVPLLAAGRSSTKGTRPRELPMTADTPIPTDAEIAEGMSCDDVEAHRIYSEWVRDGSKSALAAIREAVAAGRTAAAADIPGYAHEFTITFDGDTHWVECDWCSTPVKSVDAGDSIEETVTKARDHRRGCAAARIAENGADR